MTAPAPAYQAPPNGWRTFLIVWATQSISVFGSALTGFAITVWLTTTMYPNPEQKPQLAWALSALLEAQDPDWDVIERAARFLANSQLGSGEWPKQAPTGVFFHTALLDYSLYRSYFPLWALGQYETRRKQRAALSESREPEAAE